MLWAILPVLVLVRITASSAVPDKEVCSVYEHGDVRLVNGSSPREGRVELCIDGTWGRVGGRFWGPEDAGVVCRQLGFPGYDPENDEVSQCATALSETPECFGRGNGTLFHIVRAHCCGGESRLTDCPIDNGGNISQRSDAGVVCLPTLYSARDVTVYTGVEEVTVSWSESVADVEALIRYDITCGVGNSVQLEASVDSTTHTFTFQRYGPDSYTCCVTSVLKTNQNLMYRESEAQCATSENTVAVSTGGGGATDNGASTVMSGDIVMSGDTNNGASTERAGDMVECSAGVVGGVLGFIIALLLLLLTLCTLTLAYTHCTRPRQKQGEHLSRAVEVQDRTLHNPTYSPSTPSQPTQQLHETDHPSQQGGTLNHHYEAVDSAHVAMERPREANVSTRRNVAYGDISHQYDRIADAASQPHEHEDGHHGDTPVSDIDPMRYEVSAAYTAK